MRGERIELYEDRSGEWRWRWVAANHEPIADSGEGYTTHENARDAAERVRKNNPEVPIYEVEA
jgi:uncharacterized protein YegP (UPF0339 family)